jgi:hypothetical protein
MKMPVFVITIHGITLFPLFFYFFAFHCSSVLFIYFLINNGKIFFAGHSGRAVWGVGLGRLVAGVVGSNPAQGMDVCPRLSVLCCPVYTEALRRADHSSKESYRMFK